MALGLTLSQQQLLDAAREARSAAYAPYSKFKVGAAVRTESGQIYAGCNVENASYALSICAERVAIFKAVAAGDVKIIELALCTDASRPSTPCGACRQVLFEFSQSAVVIMGNLDGSKIVSNINELFPQPFRLES
jgi:cytidine deaminase